MVISLLESKIFLCISYCNYSTVDPTLDCIEWLEVKKVHFQLLYQLIEHAFFQYVREALV
jgi:hypothetical protein